MNQTDIIRPSVCDMGGKTATEALNAALIDVAGSLNKK